MMVLAGLGLLVYLAVGLFVGAFSGFLWGSTSRWAGISLPVWMEWSLVGLSGLLWPLFVAFVAIRVWLWGPFNVGWFT